jgi:uncharacterized protein HemX
MKALIAVAVVVAGTLCGLLGVGVGYVVWGQHDANLELARVRRWLAEEMQRSDERHKELEAKLKQAEADIRKAEGVVKDAQDDWRAERQRRRALEERQAVQERDLPPRLSAPGGARPAPAPGSQAVGAATVSPPSRPRP